MVSLLIDNIIVPQFTKQINRPALLNKKSYTGPANEFQLLYDSQKVQDSGKLGH